MESIVGKNGKFECGFIALSLLKEYRELLNEEFNDDSNFIDINNHLSKFLSLKLNELLSSLKLFDEFKLNFGKELDEFTARYDEDNLNDGFSCFTLDNYLELKARYGLKRLEILTCINSNSTCLDEKELKFLIHIFKKIALSQEITSEEVSNEYF